MDATQLPETVMITTLAQKTLVTLSPDALTLSLLVMITMLVL
jgi:hypothetical protein